MIGQPILQKRLMDRERALRELFPQIDARLIKAIVLDGDDMDSAVDFLIKESMQSNSTKPGPASKSASQLGHVDDTYMLSGVKNHYAIDVEKEGELADSCCDKHEESIVWKGGLRTDVSENPYTSYPKPENGGWGSVYHYDSNQWQRQQSEVAVLPANQSIDWWAATWPGKLGGRDGDGSSTSSRQTESEIVEELGNCWSNMEQPKTIEVLPQLNQLQGPNVDRCNSSIDLTQCLILDDGAAKDFPKGGQSKASEILAALETPLLLSQECPKGFQPKANEASLLEEENPFVSFSDELFWLTERYLDDDDDDKPSFDQSVNKKGVYEDCVVQKTMCESSRHNINIEDLDKRVYEAKKCKENMRKEIEDIHLLRLKAEQEEAAAQHAKTEAANGGLEIFLKVEEIRQQLSRERAEIEMRAAEIYGEKSVLAMEARELKSRLLETEAEQTKALTVINDIRSTLLARLETAAQERHAAMEETKRKVKNAQELLAIEQASTQKVAHDSRALEAEVEMCKRLRDLLIERGNIIDSLQGEMAVLSEDVVTFKKQVDEGIPLSSSRSLSMSRMSQLTEQFLSSPLSPPSSPISCRSSRCLISGSSSCLNSLDSASVVSALSLATSELPRRVQPIECTLHTQYFSPDSSLVETCDQGLFENLHSESEKGLDGGQLGEEMTQKPVTTANNAGDDGWHVQLEDEDWHMLGTAEKKKKEKSYSASSCVPDCRALRHNMHGIAGGGNSQ